MVSFFGDNQESHYCEVSYTLIRLEPCQVPGMAKHRLILNLLKSFHLVVKSCNSVMWISYGRGVVNNIAVIKVLRFYTFGQAI